MSAFGVGLSWAHSLTIWPDIDIYSDFGLKNLIPVIERKINKIRNDGSKLFLSYKTLPFDYELNVESTLRNLNQIVLELEHTYSFQKNENSLWKNQRI